MNIEYVFGWKRGVGEEGVGERDHECKWVTITGDAEGWGGAGRKDGKLKVN